MLEIVARSASARQARPSPANSTNAPDDAVRAQHLGDDEDEVRRRRAARQVAVQADADDARHRLVERLAEQHGLGLDAADAVAQHAEAVDHRRVRVGADERVGEGDLVAVVVVAVDDDRARYSRLTWWTMPVPGGTTRRSLNAVCAQRRSW